AEAVRRLYPGVKIAIGPPIENGFYYDFDFPEPIGEEALERIEAEMQKEIAEGREWNREEVSREEARRRFEAEDEPYKVELVATADGDISFYRQGDFTDLCRGPHLQDARPIKALKLTRLAGATTGVSARSSTSLASTGSRRAGPSGIRREWWCGMSSRIYAAAKTPN